MKGMKILLLTFVLSIAVVAHASDYPVHGDKELPNQLTAWTTVSLVGDLQTALIELVGPGGPFTSLEVSPIQSPVTNRTFKRFDQVLTIENLHIEAATDSSSGMIQCTGSITDPDGENELSFQEVLVEWEGTD